MNSSVPEIPADLRRDLEDAKQLTHSSDKWLAAFGTRLVKRFEENATLAEQVRVVTEQLEEEKRADAEIQEIVKAYQGELEIARAENERIAEERDRLRATVEHLRAPVSEDALDDEFEQFAASGWSGDASALGRRELNALIAARAAGGK